MTSVQKLTNENFDIYYDSSIYDLPQEMEDLLNDENYRYNHQKSFEGFHSLPKDLQYTYNNYDPHYIGKFAPSVDNKRKYELGEIWNDFYKEISAFSSKEEQTNEEFNSIVDSYFKNSTEESKRGKFVKLTLLLIQYVKDWKDMYDLIEKEIERKQTNSDKIKIQKFFDYYVKSYLVRMNKCLQLSTLMIENIHILQKIANYTENGSHSFLEFRTIPSYVNGYDVFWKRYNFLYSYYNNFINLSPQQD